MTSRCEVKQLDDTTVVQSTVVVEMYIIRRATNRSSCHSERMERCGDTSDVTTTTVVV